MSIKFITKDNFVLLITGNQNKDGFLYYQAEDGQHIYLHSINHRCMLKEYGSLKALPDTITASIVEMEGVSMTEVSYPSLCATYILLVSVNNT